MKKGFKLFDYSKPGKGVKKGATDYSLGGFFKLTKRKFFDLSKVNFLWILVNFPLFFGLVGLSGNFSIDYSTPATPVYTVVSGISKFASGPEMTALFGISGGNVQASYYGPVARILFILTALVILTIGLANTGMAYVLRNHAREEYVDMPADFFRAIKKNFLQALILGVLDCVFTVVVIYAVIYYNSFASGGFMMGICYFLSIFITFIWTVMHFYMYQLLVTFKLSIFKILKNSFIFSLLGLKRNILALLGIVLTIAINVAVYMYFLPLGGLLPFFITIGLISFMGAFAAYPNVKKIMIDPYYKSSDYMSDTPDESSLFKDRG